MNTHIPLAPNFLGSVAHCLLLFGPVSAYSLLDWLTAGAITAEQMVN